MQGGELMKRGVSLILAISFAIGTSTPAMAKPMTKAEYKNNLTLYKQSQDKLDELNMSVEKLDDQIQNTMSDIDDINKKTDETKIAISNIEKDIQAAEMDIQDEQKVFNNRMEVMYMNGSVSYLDVILDADSFSDLISRIDTVKTLIKFDQDVIDKLKQKKEEISQKKEELVNKKNNLLALQTEANDKLDKLNKAKDEQKALIAEVKKQSNMYASNIEEYKKMEKEALLRIQKMKRTYASTANVTIPSRGGSLSAASGDIVDFAARFLGVPYVWGGESPSGFDCSGFTQYVYGHFGVSLNRKSSAQASNGVPVSRDELQPGDLVFFGSPIHHVGIYIGNGQYIHAPQTGDVVKISDLSRRSDFNTARRIINN